MTLQRFVVGGGEDMGPNEIGVIAASSDLARDGHVLIVRGLAIDNYKRNPVVLWNHDPDEPIGACVAVGIVGDKLAARIALSDASPKAEQVRALAKGGVVKGISIGFDVLDAEPLDPKMGTRGGLRITSAELLEISVVSIPADVNGAIVARSYSAHAGAAQVLRRVQPVPASAIERALESVGRASPREKRFGQMNQYEQAAAMRHAHVQRILTASAVGFAREVEERERNSYEARQADLDRLRRGS